MNIHIRKLPCKIITIVDNNSIPINTSLFNPSKAGEWIYIRMLKQEPNCQVNSIIMYNEKTKQNVYIDSPFSIMSPTKNLYKGLEDLRICEYQDRIWFSCTSTHLSKNMISEMGIGYFNKDITKIEKLQVLKIKGMKQAKNIIPFVYKDVLYLFDIFKLKIYLVNESEEKEWFLTDYRTLIIGKGIPCYDGLRGSCSPIHLRGAIFGCVIHETIVCSRSLNALSYIHYWMEFDIELGLITYMSKAFIVAQWGIEFVSGICKKDKIIELYIGVSDKQPIIAITTLSDLRNGKL